MKNIYTLAGSLFKTTSWKYGRIYVVMAYDFEGAADYQDSYLKGMYPNIINLFKVENTLGFAPSREELRHYNLSKVTLNDKLIIVGHSTEDGYDNMSAKEIARILKKLKLRQVGVIKLHSCCIGKDDWMSEFKNEIKKQGIDYSYLSGPKGLYYYVPKYGKEYKVFSGNISRNFKGTRYTLDNVDAYF
ncbi:hypothetical protein ACNSPD_10325 [Yersinia enterocolitica]|uniref:hypothetical protein n=1 Tax=Yersinia enterocolitica TaxID=630 RepID=UPI003AB15BB4